MDVEKSKVKEMTSGPVLRLILTFMIPLLLGNLFQQTYNIADSAIVGQTLGAQALAGVGSTSSVQFLVLGFCIGSCTGFAIPVAQCFGAKDYVKMRRYLYHSYIVGIILSLLITFLTTLLTPEILHLLSVPQDIYQLSKDYIFIIFLGIPFTILYNLTSAMLRALGDSKTPFIYLSIATFSNIFLDLFCILILKMGVRGAALATIVSQGFSGLLCALYIHRRMAIMHIHKEERALSKDYFGKLMGMGLPMGLQFSITAIGSMIMQSANNSLGSIYVSGFTAGTKIKQFALCPFDALSAAVSTFVSQNLGARKIDRIKKGFAQSILVGMGYGLVMGLILIFGGHALSLLFISAKETRVLNASAKYQAYLGVMFWVLGILNVARMTLQGLGRTGLAIFSGVMEMIARTFVSFVFTPLYGYTAICCADQSAWVLASLYVFPMALYVMKKIEREIEGSLS
jgi:putative MATE family efflux protein